MTDANGLQPSGRVYGAIWQVAWPVILYSALQWLVGAVDTWMVGQVSKEALSAVGMSRQIIMFLMILVMAVSTGTTTMTAQAHGGGDRSMVNAVMRQALWMALAISATMGVLGFAFAGRVLALMGAPAVVQELGVPYMKIYFCGIWLMVLTFTMSAAFRGVGDTKTPLFVSVVENVINVPANYVLIFGAWKIPALGVAGAALGTLLARLVGVAIMTVLVMRGRAPVGVGLLGRRCFDLGLSRRILHIGLPAAGQGVARNSARMGLLRLVAASAFSVPALAAYMVGMQFRIGSIMMGLAFQTAAASVVGQRIGAGDYEEAEGAAWAAAKLSAVPLTVMGLLAFTFARPLVTLFNADVEVVRIGVTLLRILALGQVFTGVGIALSGGLAGAGDTKPGLVFTILSQWCLMLPLAAWLMLGMGLDPAGAWIGLAASDVAQLWLYAWRLKSGAWRHIRV